MDAEQLIARIERGVKETTDKFRSQGLMIVIGSAVFAGVAALRQVWFLIPVCLGFGGLMWLLMKAAVKNSGPARAAAVIEALRRAPGRIAKIRHVKTSDSHGMFVTHWFELVSDEGRVYIRANDDWPLLVDAAKRLCPQAAVEL